MHAARREARACVARLIDKELDMGGLIAERTDDPAYGDRLRRAYEDLRDFLDGIPRARKARRPPAGSVPLPLENNSSRS